MRFIDSATVVVRSGKGGNGCVSFRREKYVPRGGPDGGDGGDGGDVLFLATTRLLTLYDFTHTRIFEAQNGASGQGKQKIGRSGEDLIIEVPLGTEIYEVFDDEDCEPKLLADLCKDGEQFLVVCGGRGGKGNTHFKSSVMRAPKFSQQGEAGQEKKIHLELKVLADVGLLGLPNAGKSTFTAAVSAARPKIGAYPFTTLQPNLAVLEDCGERLVMADIPGLIEGAHRGAGLGTQFLKHVERTRFLVHILSMEDIDSAGEAWAGFSLVSNELKNYSSELGRLKQILVVNKIDLFSPEEIANLRSRAKADGLRIFFVSAKNGEGVDELVAEMWKYYRQLKKEMENAARNASEGNGYE